MAFRKYENVFLDKQIKSIYISGFWQLATGSWSMASGLFRVKCYNFLLLLKY